MPSPASETKDVLNQKREALRKLLNDPREREETVSAVREFASGLKDAAQNATVENPNSPAEVWAAFLWGRLQPQYKILGDGNDIISLLLQSHRRAAEIIEDEYRAPQAYSLIQKANAYAYLKQNSKIEDSFDIFIQCDFHSISDLPLEKIDKGIDIIVNSCELTIKPRSSADPSAALKSPVSDTSATASDSLEAKSHAVGGQPTTFNLPTGDKGKKVGVTLATDDFNKLVEEARAAGHSSPTTYARYLLHRALNPKL